MKTLLLQAPHRILPAKKWTSTTPSKSCQKCLFSARNSSICCFACLLHFYFEVIVFTTFCDSFIIITFTLFLHYEFFINKSEVIELLCVTKKWPKRISRKYTTCSTTNYFSFLSIACLQKVSALTTKTSLVQGTYHYAYNCRQTMLKIDCHKGNQKG